MEGESNGKAPDLERFFEISVDMLCVLDFSGHFLRLGSAWERTLGFTLEEFRQRPFIEFVHPDDRERTRAKNAEVRAGGEARHFENRYLHRDGSYRTFVWNARADLGRGLIYSVARDVTELRGAEDERERLVARLQKALAEVRTLKKLLPICAYCKRVRDDDEWRTIEAYIARHTDSRFSHGICPSCYESEVRPQLEEQTRADLEELD